VGFAWQIPFSGEDWSDLLLFYPRGHGLTLRLVPWTAKRRGQWPAFRETIRTKTMGH